MLFRLACLTAGAAARETVGMNAAAGLMIDTFEFARIEDELVRQTERGEEIELNAERRPALGASQTRLAWPRA